MGHTARQPRAESALAGTPDPGTDRLVVAVAGGLRDRAGGALHAGGRLETSGRVPGRLRAQPSSLSVVAQDHDQLAGALEPVRAADVGAEDMFSAHLIGECLMRVVTVTASSVGGRYPESRRRGPSS